MKKLTVLMMAVVFGLALASSAMANAINVRPYDPGSLGGLQTVLTNITVGGPAIDVVNDQSSFALFKNQASGGTVATMVIELAGLSATNTFGIYEASNSANTAQIFSGSAGNGAQALVSFMANGDIRVNGTVVANNFNGPFGFYLGVYDAGLYNTGPGDNDPTTLDYTVYSEDSLNGGDAHALIYQGNGKTTVQIPGYGAGSFTEDHFIIAFEDWLYSYGSDQNFTDMVVMVESVSPAVPEPATLLLLGAGLAGLGYLGRRKKNA